MHNKLSEPVELDHGNRPIRKSKSTSNLSVNFFLSSSLQKNCFCFSLQMISKKKMNNNIKIEVDIDEVDLSFMSSNIL